MLNKKLFKLPKRTAVNVILMRLTATASFIPTTYKIVIIAILGSPTLIPGTGSGTEITLSI